MAQDRKTQIGWYTLEQDTEFDNTYECAAWFERVMVKAGRYPVYVYDLGFEDSGEISYRCRGAYVVMPGVVTSDYFGSLFCGVPVGTYDGTKNRGKQSEYHAYWYLYSIAERILEGKTDFELFPEYDPREIRFFSSIDGREIVTHGIFKKGV